jgi:adenylyltransferase/sulfurtransferase
MVLTEEQVLRYKKQILLPEIGSEGQVKLLNSSVLIVGLGGLGSPSAIYLAGAGIGRIGLLDSDLVDVSNMHRQILHNTDDIGRLKTESAKEKLGKINPDVEVVCYNSRITSGNVMDIIADYDIVLDCSDNYPTRFLLNDACFFGRRTLIHGSIFKYEGQLTTFKTQKGLPCYRCIYAEPPPVAMMPNPQDVGILGSLPGVVGTLMSIEVIKEILNMGESIAGILIVYDALSSTFKRMKIRKDSDCPLCGENPKIIELKEQ